MTTPLTEPLADSGAGRSCPLHYRYAPSTLAVPASHSCDVLYVVGGLYGNEVALARVLDMFDAETGDKRLVFNGDFNWFNVAPDAFDRVNRTVLQHLATRGNVETELASSLDATGELSGLADAGCGCAYPDWVADEVVAWSNQIMQRLTATARLHPVLRARLAALPMWLRVDVGGLRVGVVHGDAQSLSGWGFAQEMLAPGGKADTVGNGAHAEQVRAWHAAAQVDVFASSHTCLPVFYRSAPPGRDRGPTGGKACFVLNNGATGMPNFEGTGYGLLTRIATRPSVAAQSVFGWSDQGVHMDALAVHVDAAQWQAQFLAQWPPGSPAHASYWSRIAHGPRYTVAQALVTALG